MKPYEAECVKAAHDAGYLVSFHNCGRATLLLEDIADTNPAFAGMTARQVFDKRVADVIPMKREQTPEDIGWAAVFLASEQARNITGQALMVDGGSVMH